MEMVLPVNYLELKQEEMMYLDGGAYGKNDVRFYWNFARVWLDKYYTKLLAGATLTVLFKTMGFNTGAIGAVVLAGVGYMVTRTAVDSITSGCVFDVNYFLAPIAGLGVGMNFGWQ